MLKQHQITCSLCSESSNPMCMKMDRRTEVYEKITFPATRWVKKEPYI